MVIALIVTPEGFPLAYEVMPGNTVGQHHAGGLSEAKIEAQYGRSERVWIMDRGIPTEATLADDARGRCRAGALPGGHAQGPVDAGWSGRSSKQALAAGARARWTSSCWREDAELYVLARSAGRGCSRNAACAGGG